MTSEKDASTETFAAAVAAHRAGQLQRAEALYRQVLEQDRTNAEALQLLGLVALQTKRLEEAVDWMRQAIERNPSNADYRANLGTALQAQGHLNEAIEQFQQALRLQPGSWQFHYNLGNALKEQGSLDEAADHYQNALNSRPDCVEAHANLGIVRLQQRKLKAAVDCFQRALRLNSKLPAIQYRLAKAYHLQNKLDSAVTCYRVAVHQQPDFVDAYVDLAVALRDKGQLNGAIACLRDALRRKPDDGKVLTLLSQMLRDTGEFEAAVHCLERLVQLNPQSANAHFNLGLTLEDQGKLNEALECYRQALRLSPGFTKALVSEAGILEKKGEIDRAYEIIKPLADAADTHIDAAVLYANLSRQRGNAADGVSRLEQALRQRKLSNKWRIVTHTQLGQLYDSLGEYDQAFAHFQCANQLKPGQFDAQAEARMIDEMMSVFRPEQAARYPRASVHSTLPVFIVGMPRSGTSLVEKILDAHPRVFAAGELTDIDRLAESLPKMLGADAPFPRCLDALTQDAVDDLAGQYLSRLREFSATAERVTDKMPHNYVHVGLIRLLFPAAPIIHCIRDPRDTCLSCYFSNFLASQTFANDLRALGVYHNQYKRLMRHWNETLDAPMIEICYERLIEDPESMARRLISDLNLAWDEQCLRFQQSKRFTNTASYQQVRQPIYATSVGRWRNYEKHLVPLFESLDGGTSF